MTDEFKEQQASTSSPDELNSEHTPEYVQYDVKSRDEFLSQLGNFSPNQRSIFHNLCNRWSPRIDYQQFISSPGQTVKNVKGELDKIFLILKQKGYGLITTKVTEEGRSKSSIILTSKLDFFFFFYLLQEEWRDLQEDILRPFPTVKQLGELGYAIPESMTEYLEKNKLFAVDEKKAFQERIIYTFPGYGGEELLIPSGTVKTVIQLAMKKVRYYLKNPDLIGVIARVKNTNLNEIKQQVGTSTPSTWLDISSTILSNIDAFENAVKLHVDSSLFISAHILYHYLNSQIEEKKRQKKEEQQRTQDMEELVKRIKGHAKRYVDAEEYEILTKDLKESYKKNFKAFEAEFNEKYTTTKEKTQLPLVFRTEEAYVHRDNIYPVFVDRFIDAMVEMKEEYTNIMKYIIRSNNRENISIFFSMENFQADLRRRVQGQYSFLHNLFLHPRVLAEAIIHSAKLKNINANIEDVRTILERYFKPNTMEYKNLVVVFNLDAEELFNRAFADLSILRQIWMKITGKHKIYREKYHELAIPPQIGVKRLDREPGERTYTSAERRKKVELSLAPGKQRNKTKTGPKIIKQKRPYSRKEQEEAWRNFQDSLKK